MELMIKTKTELHRSYLWDHKLWYTVSVGILHGEKVLARILGDFSHEKLQSFPFHWSFLFLPFCPLKSKHTIRPKPEWMPWKNFVFGFQLPKEGTAIWVSLLASAPLGNDFFDWWAWEKELRGPAPSFLSLFGVAAACSLGRLILFLHGVNCKCSPTGEADLPTRPKWVSLVLRCTCKPITKKSMPDSLIQLSSAIKLPFWSPTAYCPFNSIPPGCLLLVFRTY